MTPEPKPRRIILDLCAGTGAWSQPYADAGYDVWRVDLLNGDDVRNIRATDQGIHGILAAPPCTHLCSSGARWWGEKGQEALFNALAVVDACLRAVVIYNPVWWALENPVGRLVHYLGKPRLYFDPCDYGDPWTKKTCVWGDFNHPRRRIVAASDAGRIHRMSPSPDRAAKRSVTPPGFALAFFKVNP